MKIILILTIIILLYLIYNYKLKENFCNKKLKGLLQPSYVPGVDFISQKQNTPGFNIDKQCCDPNIKKYLGWKCYVNKLQKAEIIDKTNWKGTQFYNYLQNNPLKYDGIWGTCCKKYNCLWRMF